MAALALYSMSSTVNVPVWAGVVAVVIGGGLLLFAGKKS
jgi:hypothetical protein